MLGATTTTGGTLADERPGGYRSKWRENWLKYLLVYLVIAGLAYAIIFYVFFRDGGGGGGYGG